MTIEPYFRYFPEIDAFCWFAETDHPLYGDGIPLDYLTVLYDNTARICFNFTEPGWISADLWKPNIGLGYNYHDVAIHNRPKLTPVQREFAKTHGFEVPKWGA